MDFDSSHLNIPFSLGLMILAALGFGAVAVRLRLPKVTAYLLAGVAIGPFAMKWISLEAAHSIEPLAELAISLVLFQLGTYFNIRRFKRILTRAFRYSLFELSTTFILVTLGTWVVCQSWEWALLLGALALATAPATTLLVFKELESEGPVTEYTHALVAINNLASIILFELIFVAIHFYHGKLAFPVGIELQNLANDLLGSAGFGILAGLFISFFFGITAEKFRLVFFLGVAILALGVCDYYEIPYMLTFLAMGATVANSTYHCRQLIGEMGWTVSFLGIIFFATHGAELDLKAFTQVGIVGVVYALLRTGGKYLGIWLGGLRYRQHEEVTVGHYMGLTLLSQAGAAIALAAVAVERDPTLGRPLQTIVLGTVVIFEIVGPLMIRWASIQAGEVPLAHAVVHTSWGILDQLRTIVNGLWIGLGLNPWKNRDQKHLTVNELTRKNPQTISPSSTFDEVIEVIENSRDNLFAVVNDKNILVGVIRYRDLSSVLFDPAVGTLVRAADLMTSTKNCLFPDTTVEEACQKFNLIKDDCVPVIESAESDRLIGIVRRRDLLRQQLRNR